MLSFIVYSIVCKMMLFFFYRLAISSTKPLVKPRRIFILSVRPKMSNILISKSDTTGIVWARECQFCSWQCAPTNTKKCFTSSAYTSPSYLTSLTNYLKGVLIPIKKVYFLNGSAYKIRVKQHKKICVRHIINESRHINYN